jgi:hypothetical protein
MQKKSSTAPLPLLCLVNTCTLGSLFFIGISQVSFPFVMNIISMTMSSLSWKSRCFNNLPSWTSSLTRPFSLYHAYQESISPNAVEKRRLYERKRYMQRTKALEEDPEAIKQPWYTYWCKNRYSDNPDRRAYLQNYSRNHYATVLKSDEADKMRRYLRIWCTRFVWVREELPWQSHRPILYDKMTERYCAGCKMTRFRGGKLFWQNTVDHSYLCTSCYVPSSNPDWNKIMPKGYEDIKGITALKARKEQLDASEASPS